MTTLLAVAGQWAAVGIVGVILAALMIGGTRG